VGQRYATSICWLPAAKRKNSGTAASVSDWATLEYAGGNDDQRGTFGRVHYLDRLALVLEQPPDCNRWPSAITARSPSRIFFRRIAPTAPASLSVARAFRNKTSRDRARDEGRGQDGRRCSGMTLDDLALPLRIEQVGVAFRRILTLDQIGIGSRSPTVTRRRWRAFRPRRPDRREMPGDVIGT